MPLLSLAFKGISSWFGRQPEEYQGEEIQPRFPPEVERLVFERVAIEYPETIPTLNLVCWRIYIWINPLLYKCIALRPKDNIKKVAASILFRRLMWEGKDLPLKVEAVIIPAFISPADELADLIRLCGPVEVLACWMEFSSGFPMVGTKKPSRLSINVAGPLYEEQLGSSVQFIPPNFGLPLFRNVTHLAFADPWSSWTQWLPSVSTVPRLSHLELRLDQPGNLDRTELRDALATTLQSCALLVVVLLLTTEPPISPHAGWNALREPRVAVMGGSTLPLDEQGVDEAYSRWIIAEKVVQEQRMKG
ncbi:hypothetical protein AX16_006283 [Volvariella volvacea WC 439]|nr:hypothetical protein AX16_006283 [Volvariella volvacea WC 439]